MPSEVACIEAVAAVLGLEVVRSFADGMFGAALVGGDQVLKAMPDPSLEPVWSTGAATAEVLRRTGYPAARYFGVGATATAVWSLQEFLPGAVPERLTVVDAERLVALARRHNIDCGERRPWRDDAITAARGWLATVALDAGAAAQFTAILDAGERLELLENTVVHGDFHHRNVLIDGDDIRVFDWEIGGPGDWRFDLVVLAFACLVYPTSCEPGAADVITDALREAAPDDVAALMMACQVLRMLSMATATRPDRAPKYAAHMRSALAEWLP